MDYIGEELDLFSHATHWKNYYGSIVKPYLGNKVLEVGAGLGSTTETLCDGTQKEWVCVEPDPALGNQIVDKLNKGSLPKCCRYIQGTVDNIQDKDFDSALYIDVIEHIENDKEELEKSASRLKPGGYLIILVPAHNFLYSEFDKKIGHFRRYNKKMLKAVNPQNIEIIQLKYLDSLGCVSSYANKLLLKQSYPTLKQVKFWDNFIVPTSRNFLDKVLFNTVGKSVLLIGKKKN